MGLFSLCLAPVEQSRGFPEQWDGQDHSLGTPSGSVGGCEVAALQTCGFGAGFCRHTPHHCCWAESIWGTEPFTVNKVLLWGACSLYPHPWEWRFQPQTFLSVAKWLNSQKNPYFFFNTWFPSYQSVWILQLPHVKTTDWLSGDGRINDSC